MSSQKDDGGSKSYCSPCGRSFPNSLVLQHHLQSQRHFKTVKYGVKKSPNLKCDAPPNFKCNTCEKQFPSKKSKQFHDESEKHKKTLESKKSNHSKQYNSFREVRDFICKCDCKLPGSNRKATGPTVADTPLLGSFSTLKSLKKVVSARLGLSPSEIVFEVRNTRTKPMGRQEKNECPLVPSDTINTCEITQGAVVIVGQRVNHTCGSSFLVYAVVLKSKFPEVLLTQSYNVFKTMGKTPIQEVRSSTDPSEKTPCRCFGKSGRAYHFGCMYSER